jgi:hypothetical protein
VLLQAGIVEEQDVVKNAYWIKEIEDYEHGTSLARKGFKSPADFHRHSDLLAVQMAQVNFNRVELKLKPSCTNPLHSLETHRTKRIAVIEVNQFWYSLPDEWAFRRGQDGRVEANTSNQVPHKGFGDLMHSVIGRQDGETSDCASCRSEEPTKSFQITWTKDVHSVLLPLGLSFSVDTHQVLLPEESLLVGGVEYILLSVVFGDGAHFISNVKLDNKWFHYDGLGVKSSMDIRTRTSQMHRLIRITDDSTFLTPPHIHGADPDRPYKPISYRYIRTNPTTMDPLPLKDPSAVPTDRQFNDMWRLLTNGY